MNILQVITTIVIAVLTLIPVVYWVFNPSFTQMEIFKKFIVNYCLSFVILGIYTLIEKNHESK